MIYFIGHSLLGPIKIGYAVSPNDRMEELQIGSPLTLQILAVIEGGRKQEAALHKHFNNVRLHGEWFYSSSNLIVLIEKASQGVADLSQYSEVEVSERVLNLEARAHAINWNAAKMCKKAGIDYSTFYRWKTKGGWPQKTSLDRIDRALTDEEKRLYAYLDDLVNMPIHGMLPESSAA